MAKMTITDEPALRRGSRIHGVGPGLRLRPSVALAIACFSMGVACRTADQRIVDLEERYRAELIERYPPGSVWREPTDALRTFQSWAVTEPAPDGFAERALRHARARHEGVTRCTFGWVPRPTLGHSTGMVFFGAFGDFVFLDAEDRVLVTFRRWVD
jgi:hypothetical protein